MPGLKFQHIKSHQDQACSYDRLPLLAQLNVDAVNLANQYQRDHGGHKPEVLLTRWAGAQLIFPSETVTSHYESAIRHQATAETLREHIRERNQWPTTVFITVNWNAHGKSIQQHIQCRTHIIKLVHGILPTNAKLHRNNNIRSRCPCCRQETETWEHILKCTMPSCTEWHQNMIKAVDRKCESLQTQPALRALLTKALHEWLQWNDGEMEEPFAMTPESNTPNEQRRLIARQNDIGWNQHILLGRFCQDWSDIQEAHYATMLNPKLGKQRTGLRWQTTIIGEIWAQWFIVWEIRNNDLHGTNETAKARADREETERALRDIYDLRDQMEPSVQQLLCRELTDHFAKPLWFNKNWLAIHGPLVKQSVKRAKKKAMQGVRSIRQYFTPR